MKAKKILIFRLENLLSSERSDLSGWSMIDGPNARVESSYAPKPRRKSKLIHGQRGLINQFFGEMKTARLGHGDGRGSQVAEEKPPQVARTHAQPLRQHFYPAVLKPTLADKPQSSRNRI